MEAWQAAFDLHPRPILLLSHQSDIILVNRACHQIFEDPGSLIGQHVSTLPLVWQDGPSQAFQDLLTKDIDLHQWDHGSLRDDTTLPFLKLNVQVCKNHDSATATTFVASMLVNAFDSSEKSLRMLSFEAIQEITGLPQLPPKTNHVDHASATDLKSIPKTVSYTGANTTSGISTLEQRFSQLCDAIYHNENRRGFLLAADYTFCYPNYTASKEVTPVEIDDVELFFDNFHVWDLDFKRRLTFPELPSIWLNHHRTKFSNQRYVLREDGKDLIIETSGDPLYDPKTGDFLGGVVWISILGEYADVMADELKYSLSDFKNICDRLPHLLWTVDATGMADYFSQSWYDFTGLSEEQSFAHGFTIAIHPTDMQLVWADFHKAQETKTTVNREARYLRHDGQWRWMNVRAKPLLDADGQILKWYGTSTDVNSLVIERLHAEKRRDEMQKMLSLTDVGLFEVDNGRLKVLEGSVGWLVNRDIPVIVADLDQDAESGISSLKTHLQQVIGCRVRSTMFEVEIRSRWYKLRLVCDEEANCKEDGPHKILGCSVDVTEQRGRAALEAENARLVHEATLETEKSRLKTAFLAHMSHEIRTPIAGIIGTADILSETTLDDEQKDGLGSIHLSAQNLLVIVNDILDLSKIEAGQLQFEKISFDIHTLITQMIKLFLPTARSKFLELTYNTKTNSSEKLIMTGDPGRVRQILTNLVSNAIKFTTEGSVEVSTEVLGKEIQFVVQDSGEGIDAVTMQTLFKPFVQGDTSTARRHGGTGLGLTISRNLAHMMGGTVVLESSTSKGTKAKLTLPTETLVSQPKESLGKGIEPTQEPGATVPLGIERPRPSRRSISIPANVKLEDNSKPKVEAVNAAESSGSQPLVLIVEDNAINQKVAVSLVRKLGYATHTAWNGREALDFLESSINSDERSQATLPRCPNLILMDCQMPLLDGYSATRLLRTDPKYRTLRTIPVVALTASAIQGDQERCKAAGMDDYLSKPVNKTVLQAMLLKWIGGESISTVISEGEK